MDEGVEDAVPFFIDNQTFLFCTPRENPNGNILHIYKWLSEEKKFVFLKSLSFKENVARMSGAFFIIIISLYARHKNVICSMGTQSHYKKQI